jgi:regulatory protein YycI of two-component signal transduction system YycFG
MNLGKAKLVFIFAFLGLNLFLAYQLFWPDARKLVQPLVSTHELRQVEAHLIENNYYLQADINRAAQKSGFLTVSPISNCSRS